MRSLTLSLAFLCAALSTPALAKSAFFVQLGTAATEQEAQKRWDELKTAYPALLGPLEYSPRTVTPVGGGNSEFRLQAGPARSREQARRICASMMAKEAECFIVETAVFEGSVSFPKIAASSMKDQPGPTAFKEIPKEAPQAVVAAKEEAPTKTEAAANAETAAKEEALAKDVQILATLAPAAGASETPAPAAAPVETESAQQVKAIEQEDAKENEGGVFAWIERQFDFSSDEEMPETAQAAPVQEVKEEVKAEPMPAPVEEPKAIAEAAPVSEEFKAALKAPEPVPTPEPVKVEIPAAAPEPKPLLASGPAPTGQVKVAEAIPVPLTEQPAPLAEAPVEQKLVTVSGSEAPLRVRQSGPASISASSWLRIGGFAAEDDAYEFAAIVREKTGVDVRTRITKPLFARHARGSSRVALNLGPVETKEIAGQICAMAAEFDEGLRCGSDAGATRAAGRGGFPAGEYFPRRELSPAAGLPTPERSPGFAQAGGNVRSYDAPVRSIFADKAPSRYFAQLGTYRSRAEASRRWDSIKSAAGALLKGQYPDIRAPKNSSMNARGGVHLRTGPYEGRAEAENLCAGLEKKGTPCLVVPE